MEEVTNRSEQNSSPNNHNSSQQIMNKPLYSDPLDNDLDNKFYNESPGSQNKNCNVQNATDSHPLMYPNSPDYPDLIPEKAKTKSVTSYDDQCFNPTAHSSENDLDIECSGESQDSLEKKLHLEQSAFHEYMEKLPDFPESPSVLKKSLMFDLPLEISELEISDTENDKSIYEAHLSSNLQHVSMKLNEKEGNLNFLAHKKQSNKLRRVKVLHTDASPDSDDISSIDSNSESLKSEDVFVGPTEKSLDLDDEITSPEPIEPLSADNERRHARYWQRMVLPGGEQRTIDMRVIEPYKRVLSHGGYLRAPAREHTAIVIFSACFLPDRSRVDYDYVMDNLFLYVLWTLERLVTDDYLLVYLHGGATRLPSFSWLKKCYQMVGRKLRKNLSHLYLVHPTLWIKTMLFMAKPFISSKFYRKISFIASLRELSNRIPLEMAAVPDKVKAYDKLNCV